MDNIQQRETLGLFLRFTSTLNFNFIINKNLNSKLNLIVSQIILDQIIKNNCICQVRCGVLSSKDDVLTKENHQCLEKCTNHLIDSFRKVQDAYK